MDKIKDQFLGVAYMKSNDKPNTILDAIQETHGFNSREKHNPIGVLAVTLSDDVTIEVDREYDLTNLVQYFG